MNVIAGNNDVDAAVLKEAGTVTSPTAKGPP